MKCWACKDGWHWEPDGYGCGQWTLCARCGGKSYLEESDNVDQQKEILNNGSKRKSVCSCAATATKSAGRTALCANKGDRYPKNDQ